MATNQRFGLGKLLRRGEADNARDRSPVDQPARATGEMPAWNSSTTCIANLQRAMSAQGWGSLPVVQVPLAPEPAEPLPERPTDMGEGLWR